MPLGLFLWCKGPFFRKLWGKINYLFVSRSLFLAKARSRSNIQQLCKTYSSFGASILSSKASSYHKDPGFGGFTGHNSLVQQIGRFEFFFLEPWQQKSRQLQESFEECSISHVFREFNSESNSLSKEALASPVGVL